MRAATIFLVSLFINESTLAQDFSKVFQWKKPPGESLEEYIRSQAKTLDSIPDPVIKVQRTDEFRASVSIRLGPKALYGRALSDNYPPETYQKLAVIADRAVKVFIDDQAVGSGFFLCNDVVLTCLHNLREPDSDSGNLVDSTRISVGLHGGSTHHCIDMILGGNRTLSDGTSVGLDYAVLAVDLSENSHIPPFPAVIPFTGNPTAACNRKGASICVIGFPAVGERMISDNAFVVVPHLGSSTSLAETRSGFLDYVQSEIDRVTALPSEEENFLNEMRSRFDSSFIEGTGSTNSNNYSKFYSKFYSPPTISGASLNPAPTFSLDSDTSGGSSGSMVLDRRTVRVVGLFIAGIEGEESTEQISGFVPGPFQPSAQVHLSEAAIPINYILTDIKQSLDASPPDLPPYFLQLKQKISNLSL